MEWIKITAETPLEEVQRMHKQIWDYVMEHGEKPGGCPYIQKCAACEYNDKYDNTCITCPIKWPESKTCMSKDSLFYRWAETRSPDIARQIRDVEFKTKEEILG